MKVWYDYAEANGSTNRLSPREDFSHAATTDSSSKRNPLTPEPTETALALWINDRKAKGLGGGVRLRSLSSKRNGLYSIANVEVA